MWSHWNEFLDITPGSTVHLQELDCEGDFFKALPWEHVISIEMRDNNNADDPRVSRTLYIRAITNRVQFRWTIFIGRRGRMVRGADINIERLSEVWKVLRDAQKNDALLTGAITDMELITENLKSEADSWLKRIREWVGQIESSAEAIEQLARQPDADGDVLTLRTVRRAIWEGRYDDASKAYKNSGRRVPEVDQQLAHVEESKLALVDALTRVIGDGTVADGITGGEPA